MKKIAQRNLRGRWNVRRIFGFLLGFLVLFPFAPVRAEVSETTIDYALPRTVWLITLDKNMQEFGTCSGAFISPYGLILTASHCIRAMEDVPELDLKKGDLIRSDGLTNIGLNPTDPKKVKPIMALRATRVIDNPIFDVALLQVIGELGQGGNVQKLPAGFRVPYLPVGDHDDIKIGQSIAVLGFPGVGGGTVTVVKGNVTGFTADENDQRYEMKHNAEAGPGASGGPVINEKGEVLAVHVLIFTNIKTTAKSYRAILTKPVFESLAQLLPKDPGMASYFQGVLSYVLKDVKLPPPPTTSVAVTPPPVNPTVVPANPPVVNPEAPPVVNPPVAAPPPLAQVPQQSLPPQPTAVGVIIQSRIMDPTSGVGIPGAMVGIFKAGADPKKVTKDDVISMGHADAQGYIRTTPPIPRNAKYPVVIMAKGYKSIATSLEIPADAKDVLEKEIVYLKRQ